MRRIDRCIPCHGRRGQLYLKYMSPEPSNLHVQHTNVYMRLVSLENSRIVPGSDSVVAKHSIDWVHAPRSRSKPRCAEQRGDRASESHRDAEETSNRNEKRGDRKDVEGSNGRSRTAPEIPSNSTC